MKRVISTVLMMVILLTSFIYANPNGTNTVTMLMDGRNVSFHVVNLSMFGEAVKPDVPPVLYNNRTLLPVRFVAESMGAEVEWDQEQYAATIRTEDKEILLMIDSPIAVVNGEIKMLPDEVPPKILTYQGSGRTMVPVRFVAEVLGLDVDWNQTTRTAIVDHKKVDESLGVVKDIRFTTEGMFPEIRIHTGREVKYDVLKLSSPKRLVFDFENTKFDLTDKNILQANSSLLQAARKVGISNINASQFKLDPLTTRVVMTLEDFKNYNVYYDEVSGEMVISFINYVYSVKRDVINMQEAIVIEGNNVTNYNMMMLDNPNRLVVDIKDAFLDYAGNIQNFIVESNNIKGIRINEFKPDHHYDPDDKIVRVVLDLYEEYDIANMEYAVEENRLTVFLEGKPLEALKYEETDWTTSTIKLLADAVTNYNFNVTNGGRTLEIAVPKRDIQLPLKTIRVDDHIINTISVEESSRGNEYIIIIEIEEGVTYSVTSPDHGREFVLQLSNKDLKYRQMLVVIDPGHGGNDPGAISPVRGIRESNLVLDVSHRLNKLLQEAGFRTYMIRETDVTVSLVDRVGVANQLQADLFVSVHANAATNRSAHGIENLYYPSEKNPHDHRDNRKLAQIFQREMVAAMGAHNRGIVAREGLYVLRETNMPAVLSEIGFLTNAAEEEKLATDAYRQLAAEAMFKAITAYFEEINK